MSDTPATAQAYTRLKRMVIDLHLRPGEVLMVQSLAAELELSRTPVREALVRLMHDGLVEEAPGRRFRVTDITMNGVVNIYEVRERLEGLAVERFAGNCNDSNLKELEEIIASMRKSLELGNYDDFMASDLRFHEVVIEHSGNDVLIGLLRQLVDRVQRIRYMTIGISHRMEDSLTEHSEVLNRIRAGDADGARTALLAHLRNVRKAIADLLDQPNNVAVKNALLRAHTSSRT